MTIRKVPVSERALFQRINRNLNRNDRKLCTARGFWDGRVWQEDTNLGRYYVVDIRRNLVVDAHVNLEQFGRDLEVLAPWEAMETAK